MTMLTKILHSARAVRDSRATTKVAAGAREARLANAPIAELFEYLSTTEQGLAPEQIEHTREAFGPNTVTHRDRNTFAHRLYRATANPFILILALLAGLSWLTDVRLAAEPDYTKIVILSVVIAWSVVMHMVQESRSAGAAARLLSLVKNTCAVTRQGEGERELPFDEVVCGDRVRLAAGDMIPADMRIVEAKDLFVNEAALTGESEPREIASGVDMARMGTTVVSGAGWGIVVLTGDDTMLGRVAKDVSARPPKTSFEQGVESISRVLLAFMAVMVPLVFVLSGLTKGTWVGALVFAMSVAVGLTPEMLPTIVTTCLARGAVVMSRKKVIIKSLDAMQNLGSIDVLCTDKTGTLTEDRVVLARCLDVAGEEDARVLRHAYLNSRYQTGLANLMDAAIIERAEALASGCSGASDCSGAAGRDGAMDGGGAAACSGVAACEAVGRDGTASCGGEVDHGGAVGCSGVAYRCGAVLRGGCAGECNDAAGERGDTAGAVSPACPELARLDAFTKMDEIPFDFERRRMSVAVADAAGKVQLVTKGAVEEMLAVCTFAEWKGAVVPLDARMRERVRRAADELNDQGMRVLAVAQKMLAGAGAQAHPAAAPIAASQGSPAPMTARPVAAHPVDAASAAACPAAVASATATPATFVPALSIADESDMVLMGYLAFLDPPKPSAAAAIRALADRGVTCKVLTGDNPRVALSVCHQVGIDAARAVTGADVDAMDDAALARTVECERVFAKLSPSQKARVVAALRANGHAVGFMGDGINDAPALRVADAGISVDTAVDIAKETASVILLEKDLRVLEDGIVEGRRTYANMIKYLKMTASSNFGNMLSMLVASACLPFMPMAPLQLILLDMIYSVTCFAIPWDRVDDEQLREPARWDARGVVSFMLWMGPVSSVLDVATFAVLFFIVCPAVLGAPFEALGPAGCALFAALFQTGWCIESMWTQTLVVHMVRTARLPFVQSRPAPVLALVGLGGAVALTVLPETPLGGFFGLAPLLPWWGLPLLAVGVALYAALTLAVKRAYVRRHGAWL